MVKRKRDFTLLNSTSTAVDGIATFSGVKILERDVLRSILDYCRRTGMFVRRRNVAGKQKLTGGHYVQLGDKGQSDLWGIYRGRHWECEVKRPGQKPGPKQVEWLEECWLYGAHAFWVDSLDEFIEKFSKIDTTPHPFQFQKTNLYD